MADRSAVRQKPVAVIAVHGVGDQKPFETARTIGDLLQELPRKERDPRAKPGECAYPTVEEPIFTPFLERKLRITVNPVVMREPESKLVEEEQTPAGPFDSWVKKQLKKMMPKGRATRDQKAEDSAGRYDVFAEFMKGQLRCYAGGEPGDTYETIRLEGTRPAHDGAAEQDVHIYELYWADLSRLKAGIFSIFTELYQLLFHLSSLGTHAVNTAALDHPYEWSWRWLRRFQSLSSLILTIPIPVFNLLLLATVGIVAGEAWLQGLVQSTRIAILLAIAAVVCIGASGVAFWRKLRKVPLASWVWILPLIAFLGAAAALWFLYFGTGHGLPELGVQGAETAVLSAIVIALLYLVFKAYNKRRPGALRWAVGLGVVAIVAAIATFPGLSRAFLPYGVPDVIPFLVRQVEVLYAATLVSWLLFFAFSWGTFVCGSIAVRTSSPAKKDLAKRSRWTGCLMLAMPSFFFLVLTISGWGLLAKAINIWVPNFLYFPLLPFAGVYSVRGLAQGLVTGPVEIMLPVALVFAGLAALPAIWGLLPVAWAEVFPPAAFKALLAKKSVPLGRWLTLAYRAAFLVSGMLLYLFIVVVLPGGALLRMVSLFQAHGGTLLELGNWTVRLADISAAVFAWLFLMRGSLKNLALGFRPVLDLLLDVDNWLREHPLNKNPKAQICGRYVSLLRYLCAWRDDHSPEGYEKIVIVAHSQGTVITADLLRFLNLPAEGQGQTWKDLDPDLGKLGDGLPLTLFTMGCPLRQLYGLRFPYLYRWARHQDRKLDPVEAPRNPDPAALGASEWVNAYRSGDYVGRHLWLTDDYENVWNPTLNTDPVYVSDGRKDFCIGAGAHTHYWDKTALVIAHELERLI